MIKRIRTKHDITVEPTVWNKAMERLSKSGFASMSRLIDHLLARELKSGCLK